MIHKDLSESLSFAQGTINVAHVNLPFPFPNHWHGFLEIIAPNNNETEIVIDNKTYRLTERQIALIPPRTLHAITKAGSTPQLIIQFSGNMLPRLHDFISANHFLYLQKVIDNDDFNGQEITPLDILHKIKEYRYSDNPFKEFHIYRELMDLFIVLGNYNFALNNDVSSKNNHPEWYYDKFHSIAKYIDEHYAEKLSLEEVASYAGFSMHHFSRIFKAYFGDSFSEHVMKQRVMHAVEILEHSNTSLLDTALASGFSSYSSFNRAFKQVMHCSPSNFRKMRNSSPLS